MNPNFKSTESGYQPLNLSTSCQHFLRPCEPQVAQVDQRIRFAHILLYKPERYVISSKKDAEMLEAIHARQQGNTPRLSTAIARNTDDRCSCYSRTL